MIPEELNRAIFEILQRARGESVQCILIYRFGEGLVRVGRDGLFRNVIMKQA